MGSALAALEWLAELSAAGEEVALILAGQGLPGMTGSDLPLDIHRDQQGFILTGTDLPGNRSWLLERRPFLLETSMPAVFGAGDVRYGSGKRVASAVGEGAVAIQLLHRLFDSNHDIRRNGVTTVRTSELTDEVVALLRIPLSRRQAAWVAKRSQRGGSHLDA